MPCGIMDEMWLDGAYVSPEWSEALQVIVTGLVFECPSSTVRTISTDEITASGKKKRAHCYQPVSECENSFRYRGIKEHLLTTILAEIRRPLAEHNSFCALKSNESVSERTEAIVSSSDLSDKEFELIVFRKINALSDAEAIYYGIRNAFAHGSFRYKKTPKGYVYYLESGKGDVIKSRMRLSEKTLVKLVEISRKSATELRDMQRKRKY